MPLCEKSKEKDSKRYAVDNDWKMMRHTADYDKEILSRKKGLKLNQPITQETTPQTINPKTEADGIETGTTVYELAHRLCKT